MPRDEYELFLKGLEAKRAKVMPLAIEHMHARRYPDAEKTIVDVDNSIYGAVAIGKMYTQYLEALVAKGPKRGDALTLEVFARALHWKQSAYPEPHTAYEGDAIVAGQAEDRAELVKILGYDPE